MTDLPWSDEMPDSYAFDRDMAERCDGASATELAWMLHHATSADERAFIRARLERTISEATLCECGRMSTNADEPCTRCEENDE